MKHVRRSKGINNARRESKESPTGILKIAERDGWKCHICGKKVSKKLSGQHPRGPTIDHLIPITNYGGKHVPENVALAHRVCNISRGERGAAQLLLIG